MSFYNIQVEEDGFGYMLTNNGEICGPRLFHGEDHKDPKQQWPFRDDNDKWMYFEYKEEATIAAGKLQRYLDSRESRKKKASTS